MIILKATNETLELSTSSIADIDYSISYVDITTIAFSPYSYEGKIVTSTTSTILAAPAGSTQRQVKLITITNVHASTSNTVIVKKDISATEYVLTPPVTLLAGESLHYVDGSGWLYYSATGEIKGNQTAAGSNKQIQFNSNGILAGDADLTFDASTNDIIFAGTDANLTMTGITNEPAAPSAGNLTLYTKAVSGRMMPKWKGPSGVDTAFQPSLGFNTIRTWSPATGTTAAGSGFGNTWPNCTGTITHPNVTAGMGGQLKVMQCTNVVTTANQILGLTASSNTLANVWRGASYGQGGFFFQCRFKIMLIPAASIRLFIGLTSLTSGVVAADTTTGDCCGFSHTTTDNITTMRFMTRDNVTTDMTRTFTVPTLAAGNAYDATIYSPPGGSEIYYRLVDLLTGNNLVDSKTSTYLPRNAIFMGPQVQMSNAANGVVTTTAIGINKIYIECDS